MLMTPRGRPIPPGKCAIARPRDRSCDRAIQALDPERAVRLATALEALVTDPAAAPLAIELRLLLDEARGQVAEVVNLDAEPVRVPCPHDASARTRVSSS